MTYIVFLGFLYFQIFSKVFEGADTNRRANNKTNGVGDLTFAPNPVLLFAFRFEAPLVLFIAGDRK